MICVYVVEGLGIKNFVFVFCSLFFKSSDFFIGVCFVFGGLGLDKFIVFI